MQRRIVNRTSNVRQCIYESSQILAATQRKPGACIKSGYRARLPASCKRIYKISFIEKRLVFSKRKFVETVYTQALILIVRAVTVIERQIQRMPCKLILPGCAKTLGPGIGAEQRKARAVSFFYTEGKSVIRGGARVQILLNSTSIVGITGCSIHSQRVDHYSCLVVTRRRAHVGQLQKPVLQEVSLDR